MNKKSLFLFLLFSSLPFLHAEKEKSTEVEINKNWKWIKSRQQRSIETDPLILETSNLPLFPKYMQFFGSTTEVIGHRFEVKISPDFTKRYGKILEILEREKKEWTDQYASSMELTLPFEFLPWHENFSVSREKYRELENLWRKRKHYFLSRVLISLKQENSKGWKILIEDSPFSILVYNAKNDYWISKYGNLERREDFIADESNLLGPWKGHTWRLQKKDSVESVIEEISIGEDVSKEYAYLVYKKVHSFKGLDSYSINTDTIRVPLN